MLSFRSFFVLLGLLWIFFVSGVSSVHASAVPRSARQSTSAHLYTRSTPTHYTKYQRETSGGDIPLVITIAITVLLIVGLVLGIVFKITWLWILMAVFLLAILIWWIIFLSVFSVFMVAEHYRSH